MHGPQIDAELGGELHVGVTKRVQGDRHATGRRARQRGKGVDRHREHTSGPPPMESTQSRTSANAGSAATTGAEPDKACRAQDWQNRCIRARIYRLAPVCQPAAVECHEGVLPGCDGRQTASSEGDRDLLHGSRL